MFIFIAVRLCRLQLDTNNETRLYFVFRLLYISPVFVWLSNCIENRTITKQTRVKRVAIRNNDEMRSLYNTRSRIHPPSPSSALYTLLRIKQIWPKRAHRYSRVWAVVLLTVGKSRSLFFFPIRVILLEITGGRKKRKKSIF